MSTLALILLSMAAPAGAAQTDVVSARQKQYPALWDLAQRARSGPSELAAWVLLRIAAAPDLRDRAWRIELIEEAFNAGQRATAPMRIRAVSPGDKGTRAVLAAGAHRDRLNRLSLLTGAVTAMAPLDAARALEMFAAIPLPMPQAASCTDALWDDPGEYHATLEHLLTRTPSPTSRAQWVAAVIARMRSPAEIAPAARLITGVRPSTAERELWVSTLAGSLTHMEAGDRVFVSTLPEVAEALDRLIDSSSSGTALAAAYRAYIVHHLRGDRCADSTTAVENAAVERLNALGLTPPIQPDERIPSRREGSMRIEKVTAGADGQFNALMVQDGRAMTVQQKQSAEWQRRLDEHLEQLDAIQRDSSLSEAMRFYRVTGHLGLALIAAPPGDLRDRLLLRYIEYLGSSPFQHESFIEWFGVLNSLAASVRSLHGSGYARFEVALIESGHAALALYGQYSAILKR